MCNIINALMVKVCLILNNADCLSTMSMLNDHSDCLSFTFVSTSPFQSTKRFEQWFEKNNKNSLQNFKGNEKNSPTLQIWFITPLKIVSNTIFMFLEAIVH